MAASVATLSTVAAAPPVPLATALDAVLDGAARPPTGAVRAAVAASSAMVVLLRIQLFPLLATFVVGLPPDGEGHAQDVRGAGGAPGRRAGG